MCVMPAHINLCVMEKAIPELFWTKPPEGNKETHVEPHFGDWTRICVCVSQDTLMLYPLFELMEDECVFL